MSRNPIYSMPNPEISGFMTKNELEWLFEKSRNMKNVVELGSWKGRSTHALLRGCSGNVYAVDNFNGTANEIKTTHSDIKKMDISHEFYHHVGRFENLVTLIGYNDAAAKLFPDKSIDMVFIDADHSKDSVIRDIDNWLPKCKKLLCGHDAQYASVKEALQETGIESRIAVDGIWVVEL